MKLNLFFSFMCITFALEAGEKRSYEGDESDRKCVRLTRASQAQARVTTIDDKEAGAAPVDEMLNAQQLEDSFIKAMEDFLNGNVTTTTLVELILQQHPSLIQVLGKKRELKTAFSWPDRTILNQIVGHKLTDKIQRHRYEVDVPLLEALCKHGLDLKEYPSLIKELNADNINLSENQLALLARNRMPLYFENFSSIIGFDNETLIDNAVACYLSTINQDEPTSNLIKIADVLIGKNYPKILPAVLRTHNKHIVNELLETADRKKTYLLSQAMLYASGYQPGQKERETAFAIIQLLMAYGADPRLIDPSYNTDILSLADDIGDPKIIDIVHNYGIQPLPL